MAHRYGYLPRDAATISMTAEGLLCRQYLGWPRDHAGLRAARNTLPTIRFNGGIRNLYYWYYATQVLHHMEGDAMDSVERRAAKRTSPTSREGRPRKGQLAQYG